MEKIKFEPRISQAVIDSAIDGIVIIDHRGIIQMANPATYKMFGYTEVELNGVNVSILMPRPDRDNHDTYLRNYLETGKKKIIGIGRKVVGRKKSGETFPLLLAISEVIIEGKRYFAGTLHDLSEISEMEDRLKKSEGRMLYLSEKLPVGAVYKIGDHLILNRRIQELIGYSNEEVYSLKTWFQALMGSRWEDYYEMYKQDKLRGFREVRTYKIKSKDGTSHWVDFAAYGDSMGEVWILHDVTQKVKIESELLYLNEELEKRVGEKTEKLRDSIQALQSINNKLLEREFELQEALSRERDLSELKSRFVSTASHEFRTPLASILSSVDLISMYEEKNQADKRLKHINRIKSSVKILINILNDFLSLGKIEEGKLSLKPEEFLLRDVLLEVDSELQYLPKQGQKVVFECLEENISLWSDRKILSNILINLLNNAIKYSDQNVYCGCVLDGHLLKVSVKDSGIGIPEEDKRHLFTRFFRAKNAENHQGTGLGLSIVKKYLDLLGGDISFESEAGKGTVFLFKIPTKYEENTGN